MFILLKLLIINIKTKMCKPKGAKSKKKKEKTKGISVRFTHIDL